MKVFVSGTGTDVGKTIVCSWLCMHSGYSYFKPVQTGSDLICDTETVGTLSKVKVYKESYIYKAPVSPHLAAGLGDCININNIKIPDENNLIIEGAGGLLVPLNKTDFIIDMIKKFNVPTILVSQSGLGTINHTLLSLEALKSRNMPVLGVIMKGDYNKDNLEAIEFYGKVNVLASVPHFKKLNAESIMAFTFNETLNKLFCN